MSDLRDLKSAKERRSAMEKKLGITLADIGHFSLDEKLASVRNCENMVGCAQIPIGVAGPLKIKSPVILESEAWRTPESDSGHIRQAPFNFVQGRQCKQARMTKDYFIPLATTEGALVASVNRGCKAVTLSGGAAVFVEKIGITRGPVFKTKSLADSFKLKEWLLSHLSDLSHLSEKTSNHLQLLKIESQVLGKNVYVRFYFEADQAMGMNMATIATQAMIPLIEEKTGSCCLSVTGNFCVDKKPSWLNFLLGRGRKVWAEVTISGKIVKQVLKTTPEKIFEVWLNKCMLGSAISGSLAFNAHSANVIAAFFAATGQDLAQAVEGSLGVTTVEIINDPGSEARNDLYISVYLPDLPIGVVGGGTGLTTQKEALSIIFGQEKPSVEKLAQVIAGAVLAGELSLLASLAEGSLACSHQLLARGQKI